MKKLVLSVLVLAVLVAPAFADNVCVDKPILKAAAKPMGGPAAVKGAGKPGETVPFDHWAYDAVQTLVDQGIIIGYPDGTFRGDRAMTRYEFAMAVSRLLDVIPEGKIGPQGPAGPQGPKGDLGPAGPRGDRGPAGDQGVAGPKGDVGNVGPAGPEGPKGDVGPAGAAGVGGAGPAGPQGERGERGPVGPAGPQGDVGPAGPAGAAGANGAAGPQGEKGATGDKGEVGPAGAAGVAGPQGVAGPAGAKGDKGDKGDAPTPDEVRAICKKLLDEFADEIKGIRDDLDYLEDDVYDLGDRVAWLEEKARGPKAFGYVDYRIGYAGDKVKAGWEFNNLTAKLGIEGRVTNDLSARVALKVRDTDAAMFAPGDPVDAHAKETVWLDEANVMFTTKKLLHADWTAGRQFVNYGLGLLVNDERTSQQGLRAKFSNIYNTKLDFDVFGGATRYDWSGFSTTTPPADGYLAMAASYGRKNWKLTGIWMPDGSDEEEGWAGDLWCKLWGRDVYGEYARQTRAFNGASFPTQPKAIMAMADLWKTKNWALRGFYSSVDEDYNVYYSTINPYYEDYGLTSPTAVPWERWLRNPYAEPNQRTIGGQLEINLGNTPFEIAYYNLDSRDSSELPYKDLFSARLTREVADGVKVGLTFALEQKNDDYVPLQTSQKLLSAQVNVGF